MYCACKANIWGTLALLLLLAGCKTDYRNLPAFSEQKQLQVVVLTPAGSNSPQAYDPEKKSFAPALAAGQQTKVNFLPFPGNFGFIPSTVYQPGGAGLGGAPLEALILSESKPTGTVQEVMPLATLVLEIAAEKIPVVIAVPARPSERIMAATDFSEFSQNYPAAKDILQKWFTFYKPHQNVRVLYWQDEKETEKLVRRWLN